MVGFLPPFHWQGVSVKNAEARLLKTLKEFRECERIQQEVWGTVAASGEVLGVTQKYGGAVLGAFVGKKMVGFLYALLARRKGRLIHWSHMMAVREGFRDVGLGFRMKLLHRRIALAQGIRSICWTYDPLQSRNAYFNICRLGASIEEYVVNCYGRFPSAIEKGLPSDRFVTNWRIASPAVARRLRQSAAKRTAEGIQRVNETRLNPQGLLENARLRLDLRAPHVLVEIPPDTDAMRVQNPELSLRWRMQTRPIFQRYFAAGCRVRDFIPPSSATGGGCFYLLER
jgi:predicted GNAT superfamily acetyltransferase